MPTLMPNRPEIEYRRAGVVPPAPSPPLADRWYAKVALLLLSVALLTFSFAPFGQFYLAWVGLVPWLLVLRRTRSQRASFLWSWLTGVLFFTANMWWLAYVTGPGLVALMLLLGLYWAVAAVVIRGVGLLRWEEDGESRIEDRAECYDPSRLSSILHPPSSIRAVILLPAIWVSLEWFRGNWPLNGLPWLFLGHPQTPILAMCQVADVTGVYGVSFWVVAVNALVLLLCTGRFDVRRAAPALIVVAALVVVTLGYGLWRMGQKDCLSPGPTVMVVQSNYPQSNSGEKGATYEQLVDFHVSRTEEALRKTPGVDLVVWSETMMPELNRRARDIYRGLEARGHQDYGQFLDAVSERLKGVAAGNQVGLLVGALYFDATSEPDPAAKNGVRVRRDQRNVAYFYDRTGHMSDDPADRYDKVHIVPFGEYLPFKHTLPILHRLFLALSPYDEDYFLTPGQESAMTVFRLAPRTSEPGPASREVRFMTPICFEDIDPMLVGKMLRGTSGRKRADLLVNITNDGWFKYNEMPQHLQAAQFRSIENRVPTARSVNTGISGFVDSVGRTHGLVPAGVEGTSVQSLPLDARVTLYTRLGDVFAYACVAATLASAAASLVRWRRSRRAAQVSERTV